MWLYGWQNILSFKYFLNSWFIRSHRELFLKCQGSSSFCPNTQPNLPPSETLPPPQMHRKWSLYLRLLWLHTSCSLCLENPSFFHLSDFPTSFKNLTILLSILPLSFICFPCMASVSEFFPLNCLFPTLWMSPTHVQKYICTVLPPLPILPSKQRVSNLSGHDLQMDRQP